ncbi:MAG: hypothetical protein ACMXYF_01650 [Candidatus Woesearchaeota archaeon]
MKQKLQFTKGSMSLSINAIVVVVLAFVMLGLGLTLTNMIFDIAGGTVGEIDIGDLGQPPSADRPLTLSRDIEVKTGGQERFEIGYYNRNTFTAENTTFTFLSCQSVQSGDNYVNSSQLPTVRAQPATVDVSSSSGFIIFIDISDSDLRQLYIGRNSYICTFAAVEQSALTGCEDSSNLRNCLEDGAEPKIYETIQLTMNVRS